MINRYLISSVIPTPLGDLVAVASDEALYCLGFQDQISLSHVLKRLQKRTQSVIKEGDAPPVRQVRAELAAYFSGQLNQFETPLVSLGTSFQQQVWMALKGIPPGETTAYAGIAAAIGRPTACRAVAQANAANPLVILVPCHRVIAFNGRLSGYSAGVVRKQWLLDHEKAMGSRSDKSIFF